MRLIDGDERPAMAATGELPGRAQQAFDAVSGDGSGGAGRRQAWHPLAAPRSWLRR